MSRILSWIFLLIAFYSLTMTFIQIPELLGINVLASVGHYYTELGAWLPLAIGRLYEDQPSDMLVWVLMSFASATICVIADKNVSRAKQTKLSAKSAGKMFANLFADVDGSTLAEQIKNIKDGNNVLTDKETGIRVKASELAITLTELGEKIGPDGEYVLERHARQTRLAESLDKECLRLGEMFLYLDEHLDGINTGVNELKKIAAEHQQCLQQITDLEESVKTAHGGLTNPDEFQARLTNLQTAVEEIGEIRESLSTFDNQGTEDFLDGLNNTLDEDEASDLNEWVDTIDSIYADLNKATQKIVDAANKIKQIDGFVETVEK